MSFGRNLRRLRKRQGVSQTELARRMKLSRPLVSQIENGWRKPYPEFCRRAAEALGVEEEGLTK